MQDALAENHPSLEISFNTNIPMSLYTVGFFLLHFVLPPLHSVPSQFQSALLGKL